MNLTNKSVGFIYLLEKKLIPNLKFIHSLNFAPLRLSGSEIFQVSIVLKLRIEKFERREYESISIPEWRPVL